MKPLLLTFDVEEFDWPLELGRRIALERQISTTAEGLGVLLPLLRQHEAKATFFVTTTFAERRPGLVRRIVADGHEIGAHGLTHADDYAALPSEIAIERLRRARLRLAEIGERPVIGLRTPRLQCCATSVVHAAGFLYDASPHPTWMPGRYNGLRLPRRPWRNDGVLLVPISVLPGLRLPVSWLVYRLAGETLGPLLARAAAVAAPYLHLYFHPWEAVRLQPLGIPRALAWRTGPAFLASIDRLLRATKAHPTRTIGAFAADCHLAAAGG